MPRQLQIPHEIICAAYLAGSSTVALAQRFGCSPTTIAKCLRSSGVALRRARFAPIPIDAAELRRAYLDERLPIAQIAARFGISPGTVSNKRRAFGIPLRPRRRVWGR
jgi:transposase-like protein